MYQYADTGVGYGEPRRGQQPRLHTHHVGSDEQGWPSHSGSDE